MTKKKETVVKEDTKAALTVADEEVQEIAEPTEDKIAMDTNGDPITDEIGNPVTEKQLQVEMEIDEAAIQRVASMTLREGADPFKPIYQEQHALYGMRGLRGFATKDGVLLENVSGSLVFVPGARMRKVTEPDGKEYYNLLS